MLWEPVLAAAAAPSCFPLLATAGAGLGLAAFPSVRGYIDYAIQAMALLALMGNVLAYRQHRRRAPLVARASPPPGSCSSPTTATTTSRWFTLDCWA